MEQLTKYLGELQTASTPQGPKGPNIDVILLVSDLKSHCFHNIPHGEMGLCAFHLLVSETGIFPYLFRTNNRKDIAKEREEIITFVKEFINFLHRTQCTLPEPERLASQFLTLFRREQVSNTVRAAYLSLLSLLLEYHHEQIPPSHLTTNYGGEGPGGEGGVGKVLEVLKGEFLTVKGSAQTLKSYLLKLIGALSMYYSKEVEPKAVSLTPLFTETLATQFKAKKQDLRLFAGCMEGLCSFLIPFSDLVKDNQQTLANFFKYVMSGIVATKDATRYDVPLAALRFMSSHANLLRAYCVHHAKDMFVNIQALCHHTNKDLRKGAYDALDSFFSEVAAELARQNREAALDQETFSYFMMNFWQLLNERGTVVDVGVAIRGFGRFAGPILLFMGEEELQKILDKLIEFGSRMISGSTATEDDAYLHLPSFITTFALIIHQLPVNVVPTAYLPHLEHYFQLVFLVFPMLFPTQKYVYLKVCSNMLKVLYLKGNSMQVLLKRIIPIALTLTCSKQLRFEDEEGPISAGDDNKPYLHYLSLWRHFLNPWRKQKFGKKSSSMGRSSIELEELNFPPETQFQFRCLIFNEVMESMLSLIQKLDLRYHIKSHLDDKEKAKPKGKDEEGEEEGVVEPTQDPLLSAMAERQRDVEIFHHLVSFFEMLMQEVDQDGQSTFNEEEPHLFLDWMFVFSKDVILWSTKLPMQAGFYSLMTVAFKICEKYRYFEQSELQMTQMEDSQDDLDQSLQDPLLDANLSDCFKMLSNFIVEVTERLKLYKHHLLYCCLKMVLSVPKPFVREHLHLLIRPLEMAFHLGVSHAGLADIAVEGLGYFVECVKIDKIRVYFPTLLPLLNDFLLVPEEIVEETQTKVETMKIRTKHKTKSTIIGTTQNKKVSVQRKILRFLGSLGGNMGYLLEGNNGGIGEEVAWDSEKKMLVSVPFSYIFEEFKKESNCSGKGKSKSSASVSVYLDSLLPRIVRLCESGNQNRELTVAACEALHVLTQFIVGLSTQDASLSCHRLLRKIFPSLLRLATSADTVPAKLFHPLVFQLICWFTQNQKGDNPETVAMLEAILEALQTASDSHLREFSAKSLAEFLRWSLHHSKGGKSVENAKPLFRKLFSLATHPSPYRRLGYSLAVRNMMSIIEANRFLMVEFISDLVSKSLECLRLAEDDDVSIGTGDSIAKSLAVLTDHAQKNLLEKDSKERKILENMRKLVWSGIGFREKRCREECKKIFLHFPFKNRAEWTEKQWASTPLITDTSAISERKEEIHGGEAGREKRLRYLNQLTTCVDVHKFLLEHSLVSLPHLLSPPTCSTPSSAPTSATTRRRSKLASSTDNTTNIILNNKFDPVEDMAFFLSNDCILSPLPSSSASFSSSMSFVNDLKVVRETADCLVTIFGLISALLEHKIDLPLMGALFNGNLFDLAFKSALCPAAILGDLYTVDDVTVSVTATKAQFSSTESKEKEKEKRKKERERGGGEGDSPLSGMTFRLIRALFGALRKSKERDTYTSMKKQLTLNLKSAESSFLSLDLKQHGKLNVNKILHLVRGYKQLLNSGLIVWVSKQEMAQSLFLNIFQNSSVLPPTHLQTAEALLSLSLHTGVPPQLLLDTLCDNNNNNHQSGSFQLSESLLGGGGGGEETTMMEVDEEGEEDKQKERIGKGMAFYLMFSDILERHIFSQINLYGKPIMTTIATKDDEQRLQQASGKQQQQQQQQQQVSTSTLVLLVENVLQKLSSGALSPSISSFASQAVHMLVEHIHLIEFWEKLRTKEFSSLLRAFMAPGNAAIIANSQTTHYLKKGAKELENLTLMTSDDHINLTKMALPFFARDKTLASKVKFFEVLPFLLATPSSSTLSSLQESLKGVIVFDFPLRSTTLTPGMGIYDHYLLAIDRLFEALERTGDLRLLTTLLPILCEKNHIREQIIDGCLSFFINNSADEVALETFKLCFDKFCDSSNLIELRTAVVERLCVPLLYQVGLDSLVKLFSENIKKIMEYLSLPDIEDSSSGSRKRKREAASQSGEKEEGRTEILLRMSVLKMFEALYQRSLPKEALDTINSSFAPKSTKGNELLQTVMRTCHVVKSQPPPTKEELNEDGLHLSYRCQALNTLISVLIATKAIPDPKAETFFTVFCFKESPEKNEFLWKNIVNLTTNYPLEVLIGGGGGGSMYKNVYQNLMKTTTNPTQIPGSKARTLGTVMGSVFQPFRGTQNVLDNKKSTLQKGVQYISSQYLADSSLADHLKGMENFLGISKSAQQTSSDVFFFADDPKTSKILSSGSPLLEMDVLNSHPCMASYIRLLDSLKATFGSTWQPSTPPKWMAELLLRMQKKSVHINARMFMAKLVLNRPKIFELYAAKFFRALLEVVIDIPDSLTKFHYFMRDVCIQLIQWEVTSQPSPSDTPSISKLLNLVLKNIVFNDLEVLRANLFIYKLLCERWKDCYNPDLSLVHALIAIDPNQNNSNMVRLSRLAGLQICGILLANGFSLYHGDGPKHGGGVTDDVTSVQCFEKIFVCLGSNLKDVYSATGEVCGILAKKIKESPLPSKVEDQFVKGLQYKLNDFFKNDPGKGSSYGRALVVLEKIGRHFPEFIDPFVIRLFGLLPRIHGEFKTIALKLVLLRVNHIPELSIKLRPTLPLDLSHRNDDIQLIALRLLRGIALIADYSSSSKSVDIPQYMIPIMGIYSKHDNPECRRIFFEMCMFLHDKYMKKGNLVEIENDLLDKIRVCLVDALKDSAENIRTAALKFWDHPTHLSQCALTRSGQLFSVLYNPKAEKSWLNLSNSLLISLAKRSPGFNEKIFPPLENCTYKENRINPNAYRFNPMDLPLFTQSSSLEMDSSADSSVNLSANEDLAADDLLEAEISSDEGTGGGVGVVGVGTGGTGGVGGGAVAPTPTIIPATLGLTEVVKVKQANKPSSSSSSQQGGGGGEGEGSAFVVPVGRPKRPLKSYGGSVPLSQLIGWNQDSSQDEDQSEVLLRRRFQTENNSQGNLSRRQLAIYRNRQKMAMQRKYAQRKARQSAITLCRNYRTGLLPDIELSLKDVFDPLLKLGSLDENIARLLFVSVVVPIWTSFLEDNKTMSRAVTKYFAETISSTLKTSTFHSSPFVSALFSLSLSHSQPLFLSPSLIADSSLSSANLHTGIMVLENQLMEDMDESESEEIWGQLGRLYKALGENDVLLSLYENHISRLQETRKALQYELQGNYRLAYKEYEQLVEALDTGKFESSPVAPSQHEEDVWEESRRHCLSNLYEWDELANDILESVNKPEDLWDHLQSEEEGGLVPLYVKSSLKVSKRWEELYNFVDSTSNQDKKDFLESHLIEELTLMEMSRMNTENARHFLEKGFSRFLSKWCSMHPLAREGRHTELQRLQWLVEMEEFIQWLTKAENNKFDLTEDGGEIHSLLQSWSNRYPCNRTHSLLHWDNILWNRHISFDRMASMQRERGVTGYQFKELKRLLLSQRGKMYLTLTSAAIKQSNYSVASFGLTRARDSLLRKKEEPPFEFFYSEAKVIWKRAISRLQSEALPISSSSSSDDLTKSTTRQLILIIDSMMKKQKEVENSPQNHLQLLLLTGNVLSDLSKICQENEKPTQALFAKLEKETTWISRKGKKITDQLQEKTFQVYTNAIDLAKEGEWRMGEEERRGEGFDEMERTSGKLYMKFALFCERMIDSGEDEWTPKQEKYMEQLIEYILLSMKMGNTAAQEKFPKTLPLLAKSKKLVDIFEEKCQSVPCWMFIPWLSQLLSVAPEPSTGDAVLPILIEIAKTYPQALYFPFTVSTPTIEAKNPKVVYALTEHLQHDLLYDLTVALSFLTHPEHRFKDLLEHLKHAATSAERSREKIEEVLASFHEECWDTTNITGNYNLNFIKQYRSKFNTIIGSKGSALMGTKAATAVNKLIALSQEMSKNLTPSRGGQMRLSRFSTWFGKYDSFRRDDRPIEIPGQYKGLSKPQPKYHVTIKNFDDNMLVMSSIRKPKRLLIRGNDEKEYPFLVKGGEDLRQDQRIQQLFSVMNQIFLRDAACCQRQLSIRTYEVIPMTDKVGIIEWLSDTRPIRSIIEEQMSIELGTTMTIQTIPAAKLHQQWLNSFSGNAITQKYISMFTRGKRKAVEDMMKTFHKKTKSDFLRKGVSSLAASPESYLTLRSQFARSLACFSVSSYIVGIGDRHLENFLLDQNSGRVIGIDFGHAFGTATQLLPIPELVPFRLTHQFTQFLAPLDIGGLLGHNMVHTLAALRKKKDLLLTIMDVFVKEPLVDWIKYARKLRAAAPQKKKGKEEEDEEEEEEKDDLSWYPREKIRICTQKLNGRNPAAITCQELRKSVHSKHPYCKYLEKIVQGEEGVHFRASPEERENCTSVQSQVQCLIDLATDPNVVGRAYAGWTPWL